ncbi:hypothetical protein MYP_2782 [Sporocytophaga myxococcoides]|uniref:Secretion system C-terminal sorting domain-containing protein n=1 Tax=Sporocytophaga myxococcoides TaxID=153721 RepID=A0A098LHA8_9BACT|nr:T9SS type A sorting domain-containing protein [Sporocytophaga myxococcoides]GAL85553.1 hypothetical protein MYP_2782 [Sporocytophaga myxococcoides]
MRIVSFLVTIFISNTLQAQINNWSKGAIKTEESFVNSINVDANKEVYFGGSFKDTVQSDDFYFETLPGKYKILCGKYKNDGTLLWVSADGECDFISVYSTDYDQSGNLYVGGMCGGDITFNGITYPQMDAGFFVKYDNQGNPQWIRFIKGDSEYNYNILTSLKVDSENNIYTYGLYSGIIDFGDTTVACLQGIGASALLAKFDPSGLFLWARSYLPTGGDLLVTKAEAIEIDGDDNVYVSGGLLGTLTIDSTTITSFEKEDIFINKVDKNGNSKWLIKEGVDGIDEYGKLSAIHDDALYYIMVFQGDSTVVNGQIHRGVNSVYSLVTGHVLIKYDTSGVVQWSKLVATPIQNLGHIQTFKIDLDKRGNIIAGGCYSGGVDFIDTTISNNGNFDPYILRLDPSGNLIDAWSEGYKTTEYVTDMEVDDCGNYYLGGMFIDSTGLGGIPLKTKSEKAAHFISRISTNKDCDLILGMGKQSSDMSDIMIFPNPAYNNESAQISIGEAMSGAINIRLKDVMGNKVHEQTAFFNNDLSLKVATDNLVSGTYFVEISDEKRSQVKKLVVVK